MKHFSVVLILAILVSCGGGGDSSSPNQGSRGEGRRSCGGKEEMKFFCMTPPEWILNTRLTNLPKNMRISATYVYQNKPSTIEVQDTCKTPGTLEVVSTRSGSSIYFESLKIFSFENFTIEIADLGDDCKGNTPIIKADIRSEDIRSERTSTHLVNSIDLD